MIVFIPEADKVSTSWHLSNRVHMDMSNSHRRNIRSSLLAKTNRGYVLTFHRSLSQPIVAGLPCDRSKKKGHNAPEFKSLVWGKGTNRG